MSPNTIKNLFFLILITDQSCPDCRKVKPLLTESLNRTLMPTTKQITLGSGVESWEATFF